MRWQRACLALALLSSCGMFPLLSALPFAALFRRLALRLTLQEVLWFALWWLPLLAAFVLPARPAPRTPAPSVLTAIRRAAPLTLHDSLCLAAWLLLNAAWFAAPMHFFHSNLPAYDARARVEATGAALGYPPLWAMALLLLPLLRLPTLPAALAAPFESLLGHHILAAYFALAASALHAAAFIVSWASQGPRALLANSLPGSCAGWYNSAGYVALAAMALMWLTSLERVRAARRELFYTVHLAAAALAFVATVLHIPLAAYYFAPLLFLYAADRGLRPLLPRFAPRATAFAPAPGLAVLRFEAPPGFALPAYAPGQFVRVRVPAVSRTERHPFSIASAHCEDPAALWVCIKAQGDWTAAVCALVQSGASVAAEAEGPCGAPFTAHFAHRTLYFIAGGVAITAVRPLLVSLLEDLLLPAPRARARSVHVCWSVQRRAELALLAPLLADLRAACLAARVTFTCALHCTGPDAPSPAAAPLPPPSADVASLAPTHQTFEWIRNASLTAALVAAVAAYVATSQLLRTLSPCVTCGWTHSASALSLCFLVAPAAPLLAAQALAYLTARLAVSLLLPRSLRRTAPAPVSLVRRPAASAPLPPVHASRPDLGALYRAAAAQPDGAVFAAGPARLLAALTSAQADAAFQAPLYVLTHDF